MEQCKDNTNFFREAKYAVLNIRNFEEDLPDMAIVIITTKGNGQKWRNQLAGLDSNLDIRVYPDDHDRPSVKFALAWNPPPGVFNEYPNLQCIASTGAGVDHILKDQSLPAHVRLTRVVDHQLAKDMTAYLVTYVMAHIRSAKIYRQQKSQKQWIQHDYRVPEKTIIGIMGMGELGRHATGVFQELGFKVRGWSRTARTYPGVAMFAGEAQFAEFLAEVNILICLLPLTDETRDILSRKTFALLPKGAYVINVARGQHLVEKDLLEALASEHLSGACLDVFRQEPLPSEHPFWEHEKITITPHIASVTSLSNVAPQILENYHRVMNGEPLLNEVSREKGY